MMLIALEIVGGKLVALRLRMDGRDAPCDRYVGGSYVKSERRGCDVVDVVPRSLRGSAAVEVS